MSCKWVGSCEGVPVNREASIGFKDNVAIYLTFLFSCACISLSVSLVEFSCQFSREHHSFTLRTCNSLRVTACVC